MPIRACGRVHFGRMDGVNIAAGGGDLAIGRLDIILLDDRTTTKACSRLEGKTMYYGHSYFVGKKGSRGWWDRKSELLLEERRTVKMDKITCVYAIYDKVAEQYGPPYIAINDGVAMRAYRQEVDKMPPYAVRDYSLVKLGVFNQDTGLITGSELVTIEIGTAAYEEDVNA